MILSLFDQFDSPILLAMPLVILAIFLPWPMIPTPTKHWWENRTIVLLAWMLKSFAYQFILPLAPEGRKWSVLFLSLVLMLLTINMTGTLPYTFTSTTQLSATLGLALPLWMATVLIGFRNHPVRSLAHMLPPSTPPALVPVLIIIETISLFVRPLALGVRLAANLTAGHIILQMIASSCYGVICMVGLAGVTSTLMLLALMLLELMVAAIQAYVFVLLLSLYLQENV